MIADPLGLSRSRFCFVIKRVPIARVGAFALCVASLLCMPVLGQVDTQTSGAAISQPDVPQDALGRTTPRGTVLGFLIAARKGDNELAAQYLNTRLRGKAAEDLAHQLVFVLDRSLPARLNEISDKPEGSLADSLKPGLEPLGTISSDNGNIDISVERVSRGKSASLWLFSSKTLDAIPDLYEQTKVVSIESILPKYLVDTQTIDLAGHSTAHENGIQASLKSPVSGMQPFEKAATSA